MRIGRSLVGTGCSRLDHGPTFPAEPVEEHPAGRSPGFAQDDPSRRPRGAPARTGSRCTHWVLVVEDVGPEDQVEGPADLVASASSVRRVRIAPTVERAAAFSWANNRAGRPRDRRTSPARPRVGRDAPEQPLAAAEVEDRAAGQVDREPGAPRGGRRPRRRCPTVRPSRAGGAAPACRSPVVRSRRSSSAATSSSTRFGSATRVNASRTGPNSNVIGHRGEPATDPGQQPPGLVDHGRHQRWGRMAGWFASLTVLGTVGTPDGMTLSLAK